MWMRVNADLAEKRKEDLGEAYPHVTHPDGTVFGEPGCAAGEGAGAQASSEDPEASGVEPLGLHPGHPLAMTYLQNKWMKEDTTSTHKMYTNEFFEAHQRALQSVETQHPTQVQITAEQARAFAPGQDTAFGDTPWLSGDAAALQQEQTARNAQPCNCCGEYICTTSACCPGN
eukprot:GHVT01008122.1.p2 GENE.GHVT01008122.1~~GHVT01008122.1.p2  ORF type:complete len:173 (-),score=25.63 GHVT01008122.1:4192-4710(-)